MKIPRNSLCPCGSGQKYKFCCGYCSPITGNTMSYISPEKEDANTFEKAVIAYTGHNPDDYINPISSKAPIFYILMDESRLNGLYAVSGIVIKKDEIENNASVYSELRDMADTFFVDNFHFNEVFGRTRILNDKTAEFIDMYSCVVSQLDMVPFSICRTKKDVEEYQKTSTMTDEQVFISLQWQLIFKIIKFMIWKYGTNLIIHMWREQENITVEKRLLHQENIRGLLSSFPFANISIYRHYEIFMKNEILFSSLSDLVAYFTTRIQCRNGSVPHKKIINNNLTIIKLVSKVFKEYEYIDVCNLDAFISEVKSRENNQRSGTFSSIETY